MSLAGFGVLSHNHSQDILGNYSTAANSVSSSTSADTFGSWVELIADVGDRDILIKTITILLPSALAFNQNVEIEIGIGAAASEAREFGIISHGLGIGIIITHNLSRRIPASSRLSARTRDEEASANNYTIAINYIKL